jgi:hypothetical protein
MATKKPRIGDRKWTVEVCVEIPTTEYGDADIDAARYEYKSFPEDQKHAALAYAKEQMPRSVDGTVTVMHREFVPYDEDDAEQCPWVGFWEEIEDAIYLEQE